MTFNDSPADRARLTPLAENDPPQIGDFILDARITSAPSGVAFVAHEGTTPVMVVILSAGAADDAAARDRFSGAVNELHIDTVIARGGHGQDTGRLGKKFRPEDDDPTVPAELPLAPWVALAYDGTPEAAAESARLLAIVDLSDVENPVQRSGPDFEHYWVDESKPGRWRLWSLPWPGRSDRSGWLSILASWALMMLLMCLAVWVAILLFQNAPKQQPPPPVPTSASASSSPSSASPSSASASPSTASASPSSASASPSTASASPSTASGSPSPQSASPTEGGSPTTPSRL